MYLLNTNNLLLGKHLKFKFVWFKTKKRFLYI